MTNEQYSTEEKNMHRDTKHTTTNNSICGVTTCHVVTSAEKSRCIANGSCKTGQSGSWQIQQRCVQQENNLHRRKE